MDAKYGIPEALLLISLIACPFIFGAFLRDAARIEPASVTGDQGLSRTDTVIKETAAMPLYTPKDIAACFISPGLKKPISPTLPVPDAGNITDNNNGASIIETARRPANTNQLKLVGIIHDADNSEWLYIKDRETGALHTVNTNPAADIVASEKAHLVAQTDDAFILAIKMTDDGIDHFVEYTLRRE
ncbi:hypothetical protein FACS189444_2140 [Spirochaetia bacterium]|nr:hypothetical protein FACS189444_2140 [Spirochaetia bacterium]